jgi:hypothetical protein
MSFDLQDPHALVNLLSGLLKQVGGGVGLTHTTAVLAVAALGLICWPIWWHLTAKGENNIGVFPRVLLAISVISTGFANLQAVAVVLILLAGLSGSAKLVRWIGNKTDRNLSAFLYAYFLAFATAAGALAAPSLWGPH